MKKKLFAVFLLIVVISVAAGGTYAYFTAESTARNVITTGNLSLAIVETTDGGKPFPADGVSVMPGDVVNKTVVIKNTGTHPMYLRVQVEKSVDDERLDADNCLSIVDLNETDWTYSNGYYYYNTVLEAGEKTEPLFTKVHIVGELVDNAYLGKNFDLTVSAYAVQSENNGSSVWTAAGWSD